MEPGRGLVSKVRCSFCKCGSAHPKNGGPARGSNYAKRIYARTL